MTREEHITWCKKRAYEYLNRGDVKNAITSMMSDMEKHPETKGSPLGMLGLMIAAGNDCQGARRFIAGFN